MDFMERIDNVFNFIYELNININEKTEMAFRIFDALAYFTITRLIILVPLLIFLGVIIYRIIIKYEDGAVSTAYLAGYSTFVITFGLVGVRADIIIAFVCAVVLYVFIMQILNLYFQQKREEREALLEKLDKINEKLK